MFHRLNFYLYIKFVLVFLTVLVLSIFLWLHNSISVDNLKDSVFDINNFKELKLEPENSAVLIGEKQTFQAKAKYEDLEKEIKVSWRLEPANLGTLTCNLALAKECVFTPNKMKQNKTGYLIISKQGIEAKAKITLITDTKQTLLFSDVKPTDWYFAAIYDLYEKNILDPIDDLEFGVNEYISRAEFITLLQRTLDYLDKNEENKKVCRKIFEDVDSFSKYSTSLCRFYEKGWINGYKKENKLYFNPEDNVTRAQATKFICAPFCKDLAKLKIPRKNFYFQDVKINDPYLKYIAQLASYGVIQGKNNNLFLSEENITKVETATMIHHLLNVLESKKRGVSRVEEKETQPKIEIITPDYGEGNQELTCQGNNFGSNGLLIASYIEERDHDLGIAGFEQKNSSNKEIIIPDFKVYGNKVSVKVINGELESNEMIYTVIKKGQPKIDTITPSKGTEKQEIKLSGFSFGSKENGYIQFIIKRVKKDEKKEDKTEEILKDYITQDGVLSWDDQNIILNGIHFPEISTDDLVEIKVIKKVVPENNQEPEKFLESNVVIYKVNFESAPAIISVSPNEGNLSELINIKGRGFGKGPQDFNSYDQNNSINLSCFQKTGQEYQNMGGGDIYPRSLVMWTDQEIVLKNLSDYCTYSQAGDKVVITVKADNKLSNGGNYFFLAKEAKQPLISSISPDKGSGNEELKIYGNNFGVKGSVNIKYLINNDQIIGNAELPVSTWTDSEIIIPSFPVNGEKILIKVITRGMESNEVIYTVDLKKE